MDHDPSLVVAASAVAPVAGSTIRVLGVMSDPPALEPELASSTVVTGVFEVVFPVMVGPATGAIT